MRLSSPNASLRRSLSGLAFAILIAGGIAYGFGPDHDQQPAAGAARTDDRASRAETRVTPTASAAPTAVAVPTPAPTTPAPPPPPPDPCAAWSGRRHLACTLLPEFGFATSQMTALDPMWEHESEARDGKRR
jgi:hypothetical protein